MSKVSKPKDRSFFFPKKRENTSGIRNNLSTEYGKADDSKNLKKSKLIQRDTKVTINDGIKDFARIKKLATSAPDIDKSAQIADIKERIKNGTYRFDPDALADKIIEQEF